MGLKEFYAGLPLADQVPQFYVKGYAEALKFYTGVRVVPDASFLEGFPQRHMRFLGAIEPPFYFIPIVRGDECYGFVVKGYEKMTPRYCTSFCLPGYDRVEDGDVVVFVEGIKDTFLPLSAGVVALPMCTSSVSGGMLGELSRRGCRVIFCPDNDAGRDGFVGAFRRKASRYPIEYLVFDLSVKDLGVYFDGDEAREASLRDMDRLGRAYDFLGGRRIKADEG